MTIKIQKGHLLDPVTGLDGVGDILISGNQILKVAERIEERADEEIDASGCFVMPGLIDLHVHLREPGFEYKEDIESGGNAAVKGGITALCAMPNTKPPIDDGEKVRFVHQRAKEASKTRVYQVGAVTKGQGGRTLADISGMAKEGVLAISEDGKSVMDVDLYKEAMKIAKEENLLVMAHCEDIHLVNGGVMNADEKSEALGLAGITNAVEDVIVERDIQLSQETGAALHLCHCSTKDSVELIRKAKEAGLPVTGEVCPHHFILTTEDILEDHGNYKMNPPLRKREDVDALIEGLRTGIIDAIATDHAPHSEEEKNCSMREAAFGIVGLETSLALSYTELVKKGILTPLELVERMSTAPARILGLKNQGSLEENTLADITIFNPEVEGRVEKATFVSKGKNTPFEGRKIWGEVCFTLVDGKIVYQKSK